MGATMPGSAELLILAVVLGFIVVVARRRSGRFDAAATAAWAGAHGISLTPTTAALAKRYLTRNSRWRVCGAVIGFLLPLKTGVPALQLIGGYLVGAILSEVTARPMADSTTRSASLLPRQRSDYLPAHTLWVLRGLVTTVVLLAAWLHELPAHNVFPAVPRRALWLAGAAVVLLLVVETAQLHIVRRRQPAVDESMLELDDAIRSSSMQATTGAGISIALLLIGTTVWEIGVRSDVQLFRWMAPVVALTCLASAVLSWGNVGQDSPWRVKRAHRDHVSA